jgi:hypothetical protein
MSRTRLSIVVSLAALILALALGLFIRYQSERQSESRETHARREFILNYINDEQRRLNIECSAVGDDLRSLLDKIRPLLRQANVDARRSGDLAETQKFVKEMQEALFACGRLEDIAKSEGIPGFQNSIAFSAAADHFVVIATVILYPEKDASRERLELAYSSMADLQLLLSGRTGRPMGSVENQNRDRGQTTISR